MGTNSLQKRVRTVERDSGWGWIARNPYTGREIIENHRWPSRSIARGVVEDCRTRRAP
jgi:hypothetical protein